jgi:3-methyladenine DNA glycosylase AlkD
VVIVDDLRALLLPHADRDRARAQQAYLKTEQPMLGLPRLVLRRVVKGYFRDHAPVDRAAWMNGAEDLWRGPERELQYAALDWLTGFRRRWLDVQAVPMLERFVRDAAWWDLVDDLAANAVGPVVLRHREEMRPILDRWIADPDLWIRRTAILAQLKHHGATDVDQLFAFCRAQAGDQSFWIRKAIGWALRQHAHTDPEVIRSFLAAHGVELSGLSRREASKHLA